MSKIITYSTYSANINYDLTMTTTNRVPDDTRSTCWSILGQQFIGQSMP